MNRRRQNILLVTVIILSAIIGLLAYLLIQRENSQGSLSFDKNASAWTPHTKSDTSGKQQIKIPGYDNITFAADTCDQQITLANKHSNVLQRILHDTETGVLQPALKATAARSIPIIRMDDNRIFIRFFQ